MAEKMQDIRRRIGSIETTKRITSAMKLVAASRLRAAKSEYEHSGYVLRKMRDSILEMFDETEDIPPEYIRGTREIKKTCYILITGESGLSGNYNGNVIRLLDSQIKETKNSTCIYAIGSKGREHFERRKHDIIGHFDDVDSMTYKDATEIGKKIIDSYKKGEIDEIKLIYTEYINTLKQEAKAICLLPVNKSQKDIMGNKKDTMEFQPSEEEVMKYLAGKLIEIRLYGAIMESRLSEQSERRQAMDSASDNADEMLALLRKQYNRARQENITAEIIEIVSGSEVQEV